MRIQSAVFQFLKGRVNWKTVEDGPVCEDVSPSSSFKGKRYPYFVHVVADGYEQHFHTFAAPGTSTARRYVQGLLKHVKEVKQNEKAQATV